jgi:membrane-associated phospholipid phosphatase
MFGHVFATSSALRRATRETLMLLVAVIISLVLLSGCVIPANPNVQIQPTGRQIEPEAGQWKTWVLASGDELRPAAPPDQAASQAEIAELKALAAQRNGETEARLAYWNAGAPSYRWLSKGISEHTRARIGPTPRWTRNMALLNIAIYDATIAAWDAKYTYNRPRPNQTDRGVTTLVDVPNSPSYPSEHAVVAGAASTILSYLFPDHADEFAADAQEVAQLYLLAGIQYPSDVEAGMELGRAVAEKVIAQAMTDGSDLPWDGARLTGDGYWIGENPIQPTSGNWQTWALTSGSQFRPPPPPAYDSEQMQIEMEELRAMVPSFPTTAAAYFWQSPRGTVAYAYGVAHRLLFEQGLDENPPRAALIYAAMGVAHYDSFVACYDAKYAYWSMRPSHVDPEFKPLFPDPNFPSYPSAHSCVTMGVSMLLSSFFPADAEELLAAAQEAGDSRLWGGIHFASDNDFGLELGRQVAGVVIEHVSQMTQP